METFRYFVHKIVINKKYQRKQVITWEEQKRIIFDIFSDLSKNTLFSVKDKGKPAYNLVDNYGTESRSLCLLPLDNNGIMCEAKLYNAKNNKVVGDLNENNFNENSNLYLFRMGLIKHDDLDLFKDGAIQSLWKYVDGENSGLLSRTHFGIFLDNDLKKILLIKESGYDTLSIGAIEFYFSSKSTIYQQQQSSDNIIKIIPESVPESFDVKDIQHLTTMRIAVKSEVVEDYRNRRGQRDALLRAIIATFPSIKSSKTMEFNLKFVQDGNDEAINYFNEFYSNFVSELDEEIQRAIQNFKIVYESKSLNRSKSVNFKRSPKSFYERSADRKSEIKPFEDIKDTLVWYKSN